MTDTTWMTGAETRERYRVSRATLDRWVRMGCPVRRLPGRRPGGRALRFDAAEVDAWIAAQQAAAPEVPRRGRPRRTVGGGAA